MAAVPGAAFNNANEGVVEAMADAAAESIAPLVPSSSVHLADATETGERRPNERAKMEDRNRVTAVGRMPATSGVAKNLLAPPKREVKIDAKADTKTDRTRRPERNTAATTPPAAPGDKNAVTAVGRYQGTSALSRNLLQPGGDPNKPLPPPQRAPKQTVTTPPEQPPADAEESLGVGPTPASDKRPDKPRASVPERRSPQRAEADTAKPDVMPPERPPQYAETPDRGVTRDADRTTRTTQPRTGAWQYWVQLVSHRDEAMSRAELQRIQGAVGAMLANVGNRIQRADLGARGTYYRVQVGPFASATQAGQLCAQLKARHIDCFLAPPEPAARTTQPPADTARTPATPPAQAKPTETKPAKPVTAQPKPPAEKPKDTVAAPPKKPDAEKPVAKPEVKPPPRSSAEKPDLPTSTAPGLPGVLD
jgi:hypothetical protein